MEGKYGHNPTNTIERDINWNVVILLGCEDKMG